MFSEMKKLFHVLNNIKHLKVVRLSILNYYEWFIYIMYNEYLSFTGYFTLFSTIVELFLQTKTDSHFEEYFGDE